MFQSTRPHGARRPKSARNGFTRLFQSTRPHGARHQTIGTLIRFLGFNPRARMGRDIVGDWAGERIYVSIHAPAWGATGLSKMAVCSIPVSIHAPAWGATIIY